MSEFLIGDVALNCLAPHGTQKDRVKLEYLLVYCFAGLVWSSLAKRWFSGQHQKKQVVGVSVACALREALFPFPIYNAKSLNEDAVV